MSLNFRIGYGFDVHRLVEGRDLWLGGILIPFEKGLLGHSDADVLIHAICDAMLGAANLRDIGFHFPDTDGAYSGIDSKVLLRRTTDLLAENGWKVGNVDATLCAERPKINPHISSMQAVLAPLMDVQTDAVSIKATTMERLGFVGREEGMTASAVALIVRL
jgi:2-C-methyl-D-erythritol 2,4-cyclodiphosphate synthase